MLDPPPASPGLAELAGLGWSCCAPPCCSTLSRLWRSSSGTSLSLSTCSARASSTERSCTWATRAKVRTYSTRTGLPWRRQSSVLFHLRRAGPPDRLLGGLVGALEDFPLLVASGRHQVTSVTHRLLDKLVSHLLGLTEEGDGLWADLPEASSDSASSQPTSALRRLYLRPGTVDLCMVCRSRSAACTWSARRPRYSRTSSSSRPRPKSTPHS